MLLSSSLVKQQKAYQDDSGRSMLSLDNPVWIILHSAALRLLIAHAGCVWWRLCWPCLSLPRRARVRRHSRLKILCFGGMLLRLIANENQTRVGGEPTRGLFSHADNPTWVSSRPCKASVRFGSSARLPSFSDSVNALNKLHTLRVSNASCRGSRHS